MKKILTALVLFTLSSATLAATDDYVEEVFACGNDVALRMKNTGWVVIQTSVVGQRRFDTMLSIALTLVSTQKPIGYFNEGSPISWCGMTNVKPITALAIKYQ